MPSHPSSKNNDINKAKKTEIGTIIVIRKSNLALDGDIIPITTANKKSDPNIMVLIFPHFQARIQLEK